MTARDAFLSIDNILQYKLLFTLQISTIRLHNTTERQDHKEQEELLPHSHQQLAIKGKTLPGQHTKKMKR